MSTYKQIAGTTVKAYTTNPSDPQEGEMWYNQTTLKLRGVTALAAWASAAPLINNHGEHIAGSGSGTDGLAFGGEGPVNYDLTEEWNGTGFAAGGAWPSKDESIMSCGDSGPTSIGFGGIGSAPGSPPVSRQTTSATYDGSSWTTTNSLPVAKRAGQGFGTNTAAVAAGGETAPPSPQATVEEWDGTNWTAVNAMPAGKGNMGGGTGSQTAGLVFGGGRPSPSAPATTDTYSYDGTNWTTVANMNTGRNQTNGWGGPAGQTASVCGGGSTGSVSSATENWDGTAWSTSPATLAAARQGSANGIGTSSSNGIQAGGYTTAYVSTVEEYNFTAQVITPGAWASATSMSTARRGGAAMGTRDAQVSAGGLGTTRAGTTEEYDGSSWTNLPVIGRSPTDSSFILGGSGTSTAGLISGGMPGAQGQVANTDEWDGSAWTAESAMSNARQENRNLGVQTAAFATGGRNDPGPFISATEEYNGSSWTSGTAISTARNAHHAGGTTSSGWIAGGKTPSKTDETEEWNGSSWTTGGNTVEDIASGTGGGPQTDSIIAAGSAAANTAVAQNYNGTSWATLPSLSTARSNSFGSPNAAASTAALVAGGYDTANTAATEEFTGETTSVNSVDITTAE